MTIHNLKHEELTQCSGARLAQYDEYGAPNPYYYEKYPSAGTLYPVTPPQIPGRQYPVNGYGPGENFKTPFGQGGSYTLRQIAPVSTTQEVIASLASII